MEKKLDLYIEQWETRIESDEGGQIVKTARYKTGQSMGCSGQHDKCDYYCWMLSLTVLVNPVPEKEKKVEFF